MPREIRITETNADRYCARRITEPGGEARDMGEVLTCRACGGEVGRIPCWHRCSAPGTDDDEE